MLPAMRIAFPDHIPVAKSYSALNALLRSFPGPLG